MHQLQWDMLNQILLNWEHQLKLEVRGKKYKVKFQNFHFIKKIMLNKKEVIMSEKNFQRSMNGLN